MEQKYCDGVESVAVTGGMVRIDFFVYGDGPAGKDGRPSREKSHRVLLSPEAFVRTYGALERTVKQLEEKGMLARKAQGEPEVAATPAPAAVLPAKAAAGKGKSPNF
jgi:hypothetical protein